MAKAKSYQPTRWPNEQRLMIIKLFFISDLNISLDLPIFFTPIAHLCGLSQQYDVQAEHLWVYPWEIARSIRGPRSNLLKTPVLVEVFALIILVINYLEFAFLFLKI